MPMIFHLDFETEIIYSFVIILCSLMIYFGTKKLYELSSHKGIKYLRDSFLFFAIAYFFRSFIKIYFILTPHTRIPTFSLNLFQYVSFFIFIYFSSIAVFLLVYSMMWRKWGNSGKIYLFHAIALLVALISLYFNNAHIYLLVNLVVLAFIVAVTIVAYGISKKQRRKKASDDISFIHSPKRGQMKGNIYWVYVLLFGFWILNVIDVLIPRALETFQLFIYMISIGLFLTILYKVLKKSGN